MLDKTHVHLKVFSNFQYIALAIDFAHLALNSLALISHFQYNFLISRWSKKVTSWISSSARIYHYLLPKVSKRIESTTLANQKRGPMTVFCHFMPLKENTEIWESPSSVLYTKQKAKLLKISYLWHLRRCFLPKVRKIILKN